VKDPFAFCRHLVPFVLGQLLFAGLAVRPACAQPAANAGTPTRFGIVDNSFLVEEAFNQDPGVFQNIASFRWQRDKWLGTLTQEWPIPSKTHQLSYTVPFGRVDDGTSFGDVQINYRFQAWEERTTRPAFAPRVSISLPSSNTRNGLGSGGVGWQFAFPFSKQSGDLYFHWNAGVTYVRDATSGDAPAPGVGLVSGLLAGSCIWQLSQTMNLLVEGVYESTESITDVGAPDRGHYVTVSPGVRKAWNGIEKQVVVGIGIPFTRSEARTDVSLLTYFSYELRFSK
jgi:hypothetical protein